jgi:stalled ribosome rescue protein Dom34
MSYVAIWTDKNHAKIFEFVATGTKGHEYKQKTHERHSHSHDDQHSEQEEKKFFKELSTQLQGATEILILGPGVAKSQFSHFLEEHSAHDLFPKVVGVEALEEVRDTAVIEFAKKYFTVHHEFWNV